MEDLAFAKIGEFGSENGFDVFRIFGEYISYFPVDRDLDYIFRGRRSIFVERFVEFQESILAVFYRSIEEPRQAGERVGGKNMSSDASCPLNPGVDVERREDEPSNDGQQSEAAQVQRPKG